MEPPTESSSAPWWRVERSFNRWKNVYLGRLAGEDIRDPVTGEIIVSFNEEIDEEQAKVGR